MTRLQIRTLVRSKIGEPIAKFFQNLELDAWINDAGDDLAFRTKCLRTTGLLTTTSAAEYTISTAIASDVLSIYEAYLYQDGATWVKLISTTFTELDALYDGWKSTAAATPQNYWYDIQLDTFGLYPKPNSDNQGTDYVKAYYNQKFTALTADTGTPTLPTPLHLAMVDYCTAVALDSRANNRADTVKANNAWTQYYGKIQNYLVESRREKEDEDIIMIPIRNIR